MGGQSWDSEGPRKGVGELGELMHPESTKVEGENAERGEGKYWGVVPINTFRGKEVSEFEKLNQGSRGRGLRTSGKKG